MIPLTHESQNAYKLRILLIASCIGYGLVVFALDSISPLGIEVWVMNLPVILVPVLLRRTRWVVAASLSCTVMVVVGGVLSPPGHNPASWDLLNRCMGMTAMCVISAMAIIIIQRSDALDAARICLRKESEAHRTTALLLEKHVERLRLATEGTGMGTFDVDLENGRVHFSAAHLRIAGYEASTDIETTIEVWDSWVHPNDLAHVRAARQQAIRDRTPFAIEYRLARGNDMRATWLADFGRYYFDASGKCIRLLGVAFDITRRKEMEQELLGREVLTIVSARQREVGQALHDKVGQELTGLGLMAQSLAIRLPEGTAEGAAARRIISCSECIHRAIRELARGLIPVHVEPRGLFAALEELAAKMTSQAGVPVTAQYCENAEGPGHEAATQLFYIAQEAVTNAIRHGRPRSVQISLLSEPDGLRLRVSDDGNGMTAGAKKGDGLGLRIMQYRAGLIGAELSIGPRKGGGAVVTCTLPWSKPNDEKDSRPPVAQGENLARR